MTIHPGRCDMTHLSRMKIRGIVWHKLNWQVIYRGGGKTIANWLVFFMLILAGAASNGFQEGAPS